MNPANPGERIISQEQAFAESLLQLSQPKNIKTLSDLDEEQINYISFLLTLGTYARLTVVNKFCEHFLLLRVSKDRLGRNEIIKGITLGGSRERRTLRDILLPGLK
jgi:hypothetical protein